MRRHARCLALAMQTLLLLSATGTVSATICSCIPCGSTKNTPGSPDYKSFSVCSPAEVGVCDESHGSGAGCYSVCTPTDDQCNCEKHPDASSGEGTCEAKPKSDAALSATATFLIIVAYGIPCLCVFCCCCVIPGTLVHGYIAKSKGDDCSAQWSWWHAKNCLNQSPEPINSGLAICCCGINWLGCARECKDVAEEEDAQAQQHSVPLITDPVMHTTMGPTLSPPAPARQPIVQPFVTSYTPAAATPPLPRQPSARAGALNAPGRWDFFIGHSRRNAAAVTMATELFSSLEKLGYSVWLDVMMENPDEAAMEEGVKYSTSFIAVITGPCVNNDQPDDDQDGNAYFRRPYCIKELRWAYEAEVPIVPVVRIEDKQKIGTFVGLLDKPLYVDGTLRDVSDLKRLGKTPWIDLNRNDREYWDVGVQKVLKQAKKSKVVR